MISCPEVLYRDPGRLESRIHMKSSVTINLNLVDLLGHFASTCRIPKSGQYYTYRLHGVMRQKCLIREILYGKVSQILTVKTV
jgi:hypothetical protein